MFSVIFWVPTVINSVPTVIKMPPTVIKIVLTVIKKVLTVGCFVPYVWQNWARENLPESIAFCKSRRDLYKPRRESHKSRRDLKVMPGGA